MNELSAHGTASHATTPDSGEAAELALHAVSTKPADSLLPALLNAVDQACGWVLEHRMVGASTLQVRVEAQGRALMDVYAALMTQGLELSRESHLLLTERCSCARMYRQARSAIVTLRLQVTLPSDLPLLFRWWNVGHA